MATEGAARRTSCLPAQRKSNYTLESRYNESRNSENKKNGFHAVARQHRANNKTIFRIMNSRVELHSFHTFDLSNFCILGPLILLVFSLLNL